MREWRVMLGPFLIWTAHFLFVYGVASVMDVSDPAQASSWRATGLAVSLVCLTVLPVVAWRIRSRPENSELARRLGLSGCLIGFIAIAWQSLPLLISG